MQQHDGTVVDTRQQLIEGLFAGWLIVGIPIHIGKRPKNSGIAECLCLLEVFHVEFALWGTIQLGHWAADDFFIQLFYSCKLCTERVNVGDFGHIRVRHGMVAYQMPLVYHTADKVRFGFQEVSDQKESGGRMMLVECVQNGWHIAVFKAGIKGQIDNGQRVLPAALRKRFQSGAAREWEKKAPSW